MVVRVKLVKTGFRDEYLLGGLRVGKEPAAESCGHFADNLGWGPVGPIKKAFRPVTLSGLLFLPATGLL
jgi:hypothetical protein